MKLIAALVVLFVIYQVEGRSVEPSSTKNAINLSPLQEQCLDELKLTDMKPAIANFNYLAVCPEDNPDFNKFISCFWKKTGRQNENGEINYETVKLFVREGIIQALGDDPAAINFAEANSLEIVDNCKSTQNGDLETVVAKFRNCIVRGLENVGEH